MAEEARLYSYKVDKLTGDVLPDLKPGHDHCWDAVRYGLEPVIQKRNPPPKYESFHGGWRPRR
jgi:phage terminase large subunit